MIRRPRQQLCDYHAAVITSYHCRYFEIGFTRQATRSLCVATNMLGLKAIHGFNRCPRCQKDAEDKFERDVAFDVYETADCVYQVAAPHWRALASCRPDAKFILPSRPTEEWLQSCDRRCAVAQRTHAHHLWHQQYCLSLYGQTKYDRDVWLTSWQKHVEQVRDYFKSTPERLLVVNVFEEPAGVLWSRLANFFGVSVPSSDTPFPHKIGLV